MRLYLEHQPWYRRLARQMKTLLLNQSENMYEPVQTVTPASEETSHLSESGKQEYYPLSGEKRAPPAMVVVDVEV